MGTTSRISRIIRIIATGDRRYIKLDLNRVGDGVDNMDMDSFAVMLICCKNLF